jgi:propionyl-CoA synthetase
VISQHKVKSLFTAPTAFRAIKREDPKGELIKKYDLSNFKYLFLAGERSDPDTIQWSERNLKVPVIDHWWQTETGWAIAANCMGLHQFPVKYGSPTKAAPGWNLQAVDAECNQVPPGEIGALVVKLPLPPGTLPTLYNNDERFIESYLEEFPGYYKTADAGYIDEDGYAYVMSRTDDIINVAGHRLSTGAMEEVLADHPDVAECAVLGVEDKLKGPDSHRVSGAERRGGPRPRRDHQGSGQDGAGPHRTGGGLQDRHGGQTAAQNPFRQDPAGDHPENCRQQGIQGPGHH